MTAAHTRLSDVKPDRRHELTTAAFHTIAERGFEGLRVRDVAAQVGINGATLHHYFPTKEDLIQAVVQYTVMRVSQTFQNLQGNPAEQMRMHLEGLHSMMQAEPELFVVLAEMSLRAQRDPFLLSPLEQENIWQERLISLLQDGIEQHIWDANLDPVATAAAIISLMEGASLWAKSLPDRAEKSIKQLQVWLNIAG